MYLAATDDKRSCNCNLGQAPEVGGSTGAVAAASGRTNLQVIGLGVTTGVLVWLITRVLDRRR